MQKLAGIVITIGVVLFFIPAFTPITRLVFGSTTDPQLRAEYIENDPGAWVLINTLFSVGSIVVALGLFLFARHIQSVSDKRNIQLASYLAAAIALVGAVLWTIICYNRVVTEPQVLVHNIDVFPWMFTVWVILTAVSLIMVGIVLLQTGYAKWLAWLVLVLAGLQLVFYLVRGDTFPEFPYPVFLILGIALLLMRPRSHVLSIS